MPGQRSFRAAVGIVLVVLVALAGGARAQPQGEALRAAFDHLVTETARLETDLRVFEAGLPARFECPPAQPNKEPAYDRLDDFQSRRTRLKIEARTLKEQHFLQSRAGLGNALTERITDDEFADVNRRIEALARAIGQTRTLVNQRPATAKDCDPKADPIRAINYAPPKMKPGELVRADVTAVSESGKPIVITDARLAGVEAVGALQGVAGLGTQTVTITFRIADVKSRGPYALNLSVSGRPAGMAAGAGASDGRLNIAYEVANIAPEIVSIPSAPSANPGGNLGFSGEVTVIDRNADDKNPHELSIRSLAFSGHPAGLETTPGEAFRSLSSVARQSHDPTTGTYVFQVARPATARLPHQHGLFPAEIIVTDTRGATASKTFDITVRNVAPSGSISLRPGQFYHAGDGQSVEIVGEVSDDNGRDDIVEIEIEASDAGGRRYRLTENSIIATPRDDRGMSIALNDRAFRHTDREGRHDIPAFAQDGGAPEQGETEPKIGKFESWISVGNEEPQANAYGFIHGFAGPMSDKRGLCPRERFRVAFNARDAEGDKLKVTATMAGSSVEMQIMPGETTYTVLMVAPDAPGIYPITLEAVETDTTRKKSVRKVIELEVVNCSPTEKKETGVDPGGGEIAIDAGEPDLLVKVVPEDPPLPGEPAAEPSPPHLEHEWREGACTIGAGPGIPLVGLKADAWYGADGDPAEAVTDADGKATIDLPADDLGSLNLQSDDLEQGNTGKGLGDSLGDGLGRWRLVVTGEFDGMLVSPLNRNTNTDGEDVKTPNEAELNPLGLNPEYVKTLPPDMQLAIAAAILMHDEPEANSDPCRIKKAATASDPQSAASLLGGAGTDLLGPNPQPVTVAIVDTGLDWNHVDLPHDRLWRNPGEVPANGKDDDGNGLVDDIIGWNFANRTNRPWDHDGHGTFIAGVIGGDGVGVNPHARLMIVKALNNFGRTRASYVAQGIAYAVHMGARIVNVSVGGEGSTAIEKAALDYAAAKNVLVIIAAGNEGAELKDQALVNHPAVLVVAATGPDGKRAPFSNWGPAISLAAPGVDVLSLRAHRTDTIRSVDPSYVAGAAYVGADKRHYRASGTSFSAPIVTGIASLLLSKDPTLSAADLKRILTQSARDIETPGIDNLSGHGLVDARAALAADRTFFIDAAIAGVGVVPSGKDFAMEVRGTADADRLKSARLEIGAGDAPARFQAVGDSRKTAIRDGAIGLIPRQAIPKGVSTIRLVVTHANGRERETRYHLNVD